MTSTQTTTDHETIRRWAEDRGGHPASVRTTQDGDDPGLLRIDFEEAEPDEDLEAIDWEAFFAKFDERGLAFLYEDHTAGGQVSRFCKFVRKPK